MRLQEHPVGYEVPLLHELARWLFAVSPRAAEGDLTGTLVVLPGKRPCDGLRHVLLEQSGREAVLLPEITTPGWLADATAARLGRLDTDVPADHVRAPLLATLLARRAARLRWLAARPESAPGLAAELVATFDEVREHDRGPELLEGDAAADGVHALDRRDLQRIREAWRLYRELIPRDAVDRLLEILELLRSGRGWLAPRPERVAVAGFVSLDPARAELLRRLAGEAELHLFLPEANDPASRLFLASYGADEGPAHPLAPSRGVAAVLAGEDLAAAADGPGRIAPATGGEAAYRERLDRLRPTLRDWPEHHTLDLVACGDPEDESRTAAALVAEELAAWRKRGDGRAPRIGIATADTELARRVAAQLVDAGLDLDDTGGVPLGELPAGRLVHHLLQCALTGLRHGPLLELLTHPFVRLRATAREHRRWTLHFEKMIRGEQQRTGLESYRRRAEAWDGAVAQLFHRAEGRMSDFVDAIGSALQPLLDLAGRDRAEWQELLHGLGESWRMVAPGRQLEGEDLPQDQAALGRLLRDLDRLTLRSDQTHPPAVGLAEFAATIGRLLREGPQAQVRPNRREFLPVQLTGLLEARLEQYDLLIVAGMSEEVFPGRLRRPLLLGERARAELGLPGWREELGRKADLFLRLLHAGREVVVTWPAERLGQPGLPSPFVLRLALSGLLPCGTVPAAPLYRRADDLPAAGVVAGAEARFRAEPTAIPVAGPARPLDRLSHAALRTFLDCPYRFLLERGYGLREEEEVLEEFRRLDHGSRVHDALRRFLAEDGTGAAALARGDRAGALAALELAVAEAFEQDAEALPQIRLWADAFRACLPGVVAFELARRAAGWRPWLLERRFELSLAELRAWLTGPSAGDAGTDEPVAPELPAGATGLVLTGAIDRIDRRDDGSGCAVIDYKTGTPPTAAMVRDGRELQVPLYALAVEAGGLGDVVATAPRVVEGAYYRVHPEGCGFRPDAPHLCAGDADGRRILRDGARAILAAALAARDRGRAHPLVPVHWAAPQAGPLPCRHCAFAAVCRLEERALPGHLEIKLRRELNAPRIF